MNHFVTADFHFGHTDIIGLVSRPFRDVEHMNKELIRRYNERVKPDDTCYILGDVCFRSSGSAKAIDFLNQLNGHKIIVRGNHDGNNSTKTIVDAIQARFAHIQIVMLHDPSDINDVYNGVERVNAFCANAELILCGHVHQSWKHQWRMIGNRNVRVVNVGVDQWKYYPIKLDEVLKYIQAVEKQKAGMAERQTH